MYRRTFVGFFVGAVPILVAGVAAAQPAVPPGRAKRTPTTQPSPTATRTATSTPTLTATMTATPGPMASPTATATPTVTYLPFIYGSSHYGDPPRTA